MIILDTSLFAFIEILINVYLGIGTIFLLRNYMRRRELNTLLLSLFFILLIIYLSLQVAFSLSGDTRMDLLYISNMFAMLGMSIGLVRLDYIIKDRLTIKRFGPWLLVIGAYLAVLGIDLTAGRVMLGGLALIDVISMLGLLYAGCIWVGSNIQILKEAPARLKKAAFLQLVSISMYLLVHPVFFILWTPKNLPDVIVVIVSSALIMYSLIKDYKLVYVLPFKALRLLVLETASGIPIFTHTWKHGKELTNEDLFSGMIQGISMILKESINEGDVEEVRLSRAVLIIERSKEHELACILLSTRSSKILRRSLGKFASRFEKDYSRFLSKAHDVGQFESANTLVEDCFSFLPEYGKK